jgi:hypothetical protein
MCDMVIPKVKWWGLYVWVLVLYVCICVGIVCVNMVASSSPHNIQTLRVCVLCGHMIYVCM